MAKKATRISRFVPAVEDRPIYVGLDVHKKTYSVAPFDPEAKAIYDRHFAKHGIGQKASG